MRLIKYISVLLFSCFFTLSAHAQLNTDRLTSIGRNALYFDDYVLSIQYFNQVIRIKPYLAEPYLYRAIAKIQLGDMAGAEKDCSAAIKNNPFLPGAYYTRGFVRLQLKRYSEAEADFSEALIFSPENRTYILLRADARAEQQNFDNALQDIDYLLKREPQNASIIFEKGVICMAKKDTICAHNCFTQATQYDGQNPSNWSALGLTDMLLNKEDDALLHLTQAINLGSHWAGDYINRGIIFYKKNNFRGSLADYDKAIELSPADPQCYYNRGILRAELGDYNNALEDLCSAIDKAPEKTEMRYQRGLVYLQLAQWTAAKADFDSLISRYPYFLPSYYLAAQASTALDDPKTAFLYQKKAHELEENKEEIIKQQKVNTNVQLAQSQPQKRDRRKEFSQRAAQNQNEQTDDKQYNSQSRGSVQKRYTDVVNEPNIVLSYYSQNQPLRRTNYFHYVVDDYNKQHLLPSPLRFTLQEIPLTAELVNQHFDAINRISEQIDKISPLIVPNQENQQFSELYFARAVEFALVQDYSSAIDDCTRAIRLNSKHTIAYFCRANWRYKLLEYQRSTGEIYDKEQDSKLSFEMLLRDLDQVIHLQKDFSFAYYNKANMLCMQKDYKAAIEYYTYAINQDQDFAEAYFNRGLTRIYIEQTEEGLQDLSKAGELGIYQAYNLISRFQ